MPLDPPSPWRGTGESAIQLPQPTGLNRHVATPAPLREWRKVHAALLAHERAFSRLVMRSACAQASLQDLELAHQELQGLRELADAVLQRAVGLPSHPRER